MSSTGKNMRTVSEVLTYCQTTFATHKRGIQALMKLHRANPDLFYEELFSCMERILMVFKREPSIERLVQLICNFCKAFCEASAEEGTGDCSVPLEVLEHLMQYAGAREKAVRFRVCQFVSGILNTLPEDADISDDLWTTLEKKMMDRLNDKIPIVRLHAVHASARLQNPGEKNDRVTKEYLRLLQFDSSKDVRKAVLSNIGVTKYTLPTILTRVRDIKEEVRRFAYHAIAWKIDPKFLSIAQRIELIKGGMSDRNEAVRKACSEMISRIWMEKSDDSIEAVLELLDVSSNEEMCEQVSRILLADGKGVDDEIVVDGDMSPEMALFWRLRCEWAKENGDEDRLDKWLPDIPTYASYLATFAENSDVSMIATPMNKMSEEEHEVEDRAFCYLQVLKASCVLDFHDETGRQRLLEQFRGILLAITRPEEEVAAIVRTLSNVFRDNESARNNYLLYVIDELRESLPNFLGASSLESLDKKRMKLAKLLNDKEEAENEKARCVQQEDYPGAAAVKQRIVQIESELADLQLSVQAHDDREEFVYRRCLLLASHMLEWTRAGTHHAVRELRDRMLEQLIMAGVDHTNCLIRQHALRALGLYCMLDRSAVQAYVPVLKNAMDSEQKVIQTTVASSLFDLLMLYGSAAFETSATAFAGAKKADLDTTMEKQEALMTDIDGLLSDDDSFHSAQSGNSAEDKPGAASLSSYKNLIGFLKELLDDEDGDVRTVAIEGFSKLLFVNRITDVEVLSRLILAYFNPANEGEVRLRQCLSVFFPAFAFSSVRHQRLVSQCMFPCIDVLVEAPDDSPLATVNFPQVAQYIVYLSDIANLKVSETAAPEAAATEGDMMPVHEALGMKLCQHIISNPRSDQTKIYTKILGLLNLDFSTSSSSGKEDGEEAESGADKSVESSLETFKGLATSMRQAVKDRTCRRYIEKWMSDMLECEVEGTEVHTVSRAEYAVWEEESSASEAEDDDQDTAAAAQAEETAKKPARASRRRPQRRAAATRKTIVESDASDDDDEADADFRIVRENQENQEPVPKRATRTRRQPAAAIKPSNTTATAVSPTKKPAAAAVAKKKKVVIASPVQMASPASSVSVSPTPVKTKRSTAMLDDSIADLLDSDDDLTYNVASAQKKAMRGDDSILAEIDNLLSDSD